MGSPVPLRDDFDAAVLRVLARQTRDANQGRRLLALAAYNLIRLPKLLAEIPP